MGLTNKDLDELKKICDETTAGPWKYDKTQFRNENRFISLFLNRKIDNYINDVEFVIKSRTGMPACIDEIRRLRGFLQLIAGLTEGQKKLSQDGAKSIYKWAKQALGEDRDG